METFIECFKIVLTGDKEASRLAARRVRKILYSAHFSKNEYADIKKIIETAPQEYANIIEDWRRENFVISVSVIYYLHGREKQPDFLFSWLFNLLLNKNGNIRHAAVRMIGHELGPLTVHLRIPDWKPDRSEIKMEESNRILCELYLNLNKLLDDLWRPSYKRYKYVDSLPAGPYKSVQMVLGKLTAYCGEEFIKLLESFLFKQSLK